MVAAGDEIEFILSWGSRYRSAVNGGKGCVWIKYLSITFGNKVTLSLST